MHTNPEHLNPAQKEAVLHKEGPLLVVAGAGAGKTRVVTHRIAELIKNGVAPEKILAVTFTNKAAGEMRDRVAHLVKDQRSNVIGANETFPFMGTFHSLGVHILREKGSAIGVKKTFKIKDRGDSVALIREAIKNEGLDTKQFEPRKMLGHISRMKGDLKPVDEYEAEAGDEYFPSIAARVWRRYEDALKEENALDFDDLLVKTVALLERVEAARAHFQNRWRYVHIDEYQDTNHAQYVLSKVLAEAHHNICAVGDVDQNVYSWRGARIKNLLHFEKDYPNTKIVFLEENYRSTKTILAAANEVIKKNKMRQDKTLFTAKDEGERIGVFAAPDEMTEAFFTAGKARGLTAKGAAPEHIAVLYRTNFQSRALEEAFLSLGVPYVVLGTRFFERKEVKDILSYINAALNPVGLSDVKRIINTPPRGIGKATIAKLFAGQKETLPAKTKEKIDGFYALLKDIGDASRKKTPAELITCVFEMSGLRTQLKEEGEEGVERAQNILELGTLASRYAELEKFLEDAALASDQDTLERKGEGVRLMTVHAAKGLEFPYVFVTGLEQGLFPNKARMDADSERIHADKNEEERRLFYVALTRAERKLYLTYAETRAVFGSRELNMPSEFLTDIPGELMEMEAVEEEVINF